LQGFALILECKSGPDEPWGVTPGRSAMPVPACLGQVLLAEQLLDRVAWSPAPPARGKKALAEYAAVCAGRRSAAGSYHCFGGGGSNLRSYVDSYWPDGPKGSGAGTSYLYVILTEAKGACNLLRASCGQPFGAFDGNPTDGWLLDAQVFHDFEDLTAHLLAFEPQTRRLELDDEALLMYELGLGEVQPAGDLLNLVSRRWNPERMEYERRPRCREPQVTGEMLKRHVRSRGRAAPQPWP
jgi:hypothetical protein